MYQRTSNAIQRARNSTGLTQEALAERSGYSSDSVRAWESGARVPSLEALNILAESLAAPWLPGVFLREQSAYLNSLIPDFRPGLPVAEAAAGYISCLLEQVDEHFDRRMLRLVADGNIDQLEDAEFDRLLGMAERAAKCYYEMRFAKRRKENEQ